MAPCLVLAAAGATDGRRAQLVAETWKRRAAAGRRPRAVRGPSVLGSTPTSLGGACLVVLMGVFFGMRFSGLRMLLVLFPSLGRIAAAVPGGLLPRHRGTEDPGHGWLKLAATQVAASAASLDEVGKVLSRRRQALAVVASHVRACPV